MKKINSLCSWLETLPESETYTLVRDLLLAMNFDRVAITHGVLEFGRDLVFRERDRIGREIWRGVQVKIKAPSGSLRSERGLRAVLTQCEAALDSAYTTSSGEKVKIAEIWLLFTTSLTETQKSSAQGRMSGRVQVIDGSHLADLITEYLPELVRQRSGPLDSYFLNLIELSEQTNPYLSTKLGATISLSEIYLAPLTSLALLRLSAVVYINPERLKIRRLFEEESIVEISQLAAASLLPAAYHYEIFQATSQMLSLIEAATALQCLHQADEESRRVPSNLAAALDLVLTVDPNLARYYYCGELRREHLLSISNNLEKIDRPELEPVRLYAQRPNAAGARRKQDVLFDHIAQAYNTAIDKNNRLFHVIPDIAHSISENIVKSSGTFAGRSQNIRDVLLSAQRTWDNYAEQLTDSLSRSLASTLREIESSVHRLSKGIDVGQSDLAILAEARALTDLAAKYFDIPAGSIESKEIDAQWVCANARLLVIEGDLGSGKTTLLRRVAADSAKSYGSSNSASQLPLFCTLARVSEDSDRSLIERFLEVAHQGFIEALPSGAAVRWFLDGLDEVRSASLRGEIITAVMSRAFTGDVVLSSRPFVIDDLLPDALQVTILPFKEEQVKAFVNKFPWRDARSPEIMLDILGHESDLGELAKSPLLLTLMCILAQVRGASQLPTRRAGLYEVVVDLLLMEWDLAKGIQRERIITDDSLRRVVLQRTAHGLYERGRRYFSKEEFVDLLISSYPLGPIPLDLGLMLFADLVRDCIIVPAGQGKFGFLHYSVHEYLAALEISGDVGLEKSFKALEEFIQMGRWEEVLVFYAGIKRDIGPFLMSAHHVLVRSPDCVRLVKKMLSVADFTRAENLAVRGSVASVFEELAIGGLVDHWRQQRSS